MLAGRSGCGGIYSARGDPKDQQVLPARLVQLGQLLLQEPVIAMGFRFCRSAGQGPLRFNVAKGGLSGLYVAEMAPRSTSR